jgi:hypothetical protein
MFLLLMDLHPVGPREALIATGKAAPIDVDKRESVYLKSLVDFCLVDLPRG